MTDRFLDKLFGAPHKQALEQRIVTMAALLVCLTGILATIQNAVLDIPAIHSVFSGLAVLAGAVFYWQSRAGKSYETLGIIMFSTFLVLLSCAWYATNGSFGSVPYFFYMLFIFAIIILKQRLLLYAAITALFILNGLLFHEFFHQSYLVPYPDLSSRYIDIALSLLISMTVTGLLTYLVVRDFRNEKVRNASLLIEALKNKRELEKALQEIRVLKGFLPICANCKKIRNDEGYWQEVSSYISTHTDTIFSHGFCPECTNELYPEYHDDEVPKP